MSLKLLAANSQRQPLALEQISLYSQAIFHLPQAVNGTVENTMCDVNAHPHSHLFV